RGPVVYKQEGIVRHGGPQLLHEPLRLEGGSIGIEERRLLIRQALATTTRLVGATNSSLVREIRLELELTQESAHVRQDGDIDRIVSAQRSGIEIHLNHGCL